MNSFVDFFVKINFLKKIKAWFKLNANNNKKRASRSKNRGSYRQKFFLFGDLYRLFILNWWFKP